MAASAAMITRLRRMVAEATEVTYTDETLTEVIELYPTLDIDGLSLDDDDWTATYDLHAAASEVWTEKAAALTGSFDFNADGASFSRSQRYAQASKMARHYGARRTVGTITLVREWDDDDLTETDD